MKRKWMLTAALAVGLMMACPAADAAIPPLLLTSQAGQYAMAASSWEPEYVTGDKVAFAAVDLDGDGELELMVLEWAGTAIHTKTRVYVLTDDGPSLAPVGEEGPPSLSIDFLFDRDIHAYRDGDGHIWYVGMDVSQDISRKYAFYVENGAVHQRQLGFLKSDYASGGGETSYFDEEGRPIDEAGWNALEETSFGGLPEKDISFTWLEYDAAHYNDWKSLDTYGKRTELYKNYEANEPALAW